MSIGARIRELRGEQSRRNFAVLLGIHQQTLYIYEKGKRIPEREIIEKICDRLKISLAWLMRGEGSPCPAGTDAPQGDGARRDASGEERCPRCARLEDAVEEERRERRELNAENRSLWAEVSRLREENAVLRERLNLRAQASPEV